ncbi:MULTISPECIES: metallophosphoesterase family protein [Mycolicibacter]|uniref:Metallophosphoesterase family protein n=2 Tax=Mycolicibacter TaxID=1073531 RepID=A0ABU5XL83_9MYCO|nr:MULTISPECIES: metallophosphoesterase family protein [unclassified Mycolicibacter]MEB3023045.1 metallophosphoesterase family protein [Mycolicibacter sp. MYC098]MEB3033555.1 metallophosphoesterase family protein [Mycolicibacter sp. MYC340]
MNTTPGSPAPSSADYERQTMRVLVIADYYDVSAEPPLAEMVKRHRLDAVITAGDLSKFDLNGIDALPVPVLGVYGNHCNGRYLEELGVTNLHLAYVGHHGVSFTGLQGCVRYKDDEHDILYTQDEYRSLVASLPRADVLITHCPPRGINDHSDAAHIGIDALLPWIDWARPRLVIHGHTYPESPVTEYHGSRIEYVRGARIIDI